MTVRLVREHRRSPRTAAPNDLRFVLVSALHLSCELPTKHADKRHREKIGERLPTPTTLRPSSDPLDMKDKGR